MPPDTPHLAPRHHHDLRRLALRRPTRLSTRHNRQHVVGDYKVPPPAGMYAEKEQSQLRITNSIGRRAAAGVAPRVGRAMWQELTRRRVWLLAIAVAGQHVHMLVKLPLGRQRTLTGLAMRQSTLDMAHTRLARQALGCAEQRRQDSQSSAPGEYVQLYFAARGGRGLGGGVEDRGG